MHTECTCEASENIKFSCKALAVSAGLHASYRMERQMCLTDEYARSVRHQFILKIAIGLKAIKTIIII